MRREIQRLEDIMEAIENIEMEMVSERKEFDNNKMLQIWVLHYLQIIGEAVNQLDDDIKSNYSKAPWREIIGLRHMLVHQYFNIDLDIIWKIAVDEVPTLKEQVQQILKDLK